MDPGEQFPLGGIIIPGDVRDYIPAITHMEITHAE